jgi:hypothetical protein
VNCREVTELLGEHLDGTLPVFQRLRLRVHVWLCKHCRNYLRSYKTTLRAEKAALIHAPGAASDELPDALARSIIEAAKGVRSGGSSQGSNNSPHKEH